MTVFYQSAGLRGFSLSDLLRTRRRILDDVFFYESCRLPIAPYEVKREDVPIILRGLRLQAAAIAEELQRRGLADELEKEPKA